jgi:Rps23 Pro-64 3,4-dihydroxylase Tpa1-like proline 4-hydroxylase
MLIRYYNDPVPYILIDDYFSNHELIEIWKELDFLTSPIKMMNENQTGSASVDGNILKNGYGIFLNNLYKSHEISNILQHVKKLFDQDLVKQFIEKNLIFNYFYSCNYDVTLVNYYEDGNYYNLHRDDSMLTCIIPLYKEPLAFKGGDFVLGSKDYVIPLKNNQMIIFPGCVPHAVTPIEFTTENTKFSGNGRYSINQFISYQTTHDNRNINE